MSVEEKVSAPKDKVSPWTIAFVFAASTIAVFCLANTFLILRAARALDEIGSQCAYAAAREQDLPAARQAVARVLAMHIPDEFYFRGPISSRIIFYNGKSKGPVAGPFVTVKTSLTAWIPAPQLFAGALESRKTSDMINSDHRDLSDLSANSVDSFSSSLIELTAVHSSP